MTDPNPPQPHNPLADPLADARELIERLLENRMTPDEASRFEQLATGRRDVRRLYLRYMHLVSTLPLHVAPHQWILGEEPAAGEARPPSMEEAVVLPALRESDVVDDEPVSIRLAAAAPRPAAPPPSRLTPWWGTAAAAALIVVGVCAWAALRNPVPVALGPAPAPPPAPVVALAPVRLTATAAAVWTDGEALRPGSVLQPGRTLRLTSGAVEVLFGTGVRVILQGPAAFRVTDDNHAALDHGKLVARVPPQARGFGVTFGDRQVTDLGTEFGLSANAGGPATVAVFDGRVVLAQPTVAAAAATATRPAPTFLSQGAVVTSADAGHGWTPAAPSAVHFARSLRDVRVPVPVVSTGAGLTVGQADPHWLVFAVAKGEASARPAFVVPSVGWAKNVRDRSQWLTTTANTADVPPGLYVFRTTVDLTGLDPTTAVVRADVLADDAVDDVRINGANRHLSVPISTQRNWLGPHPLTVQGGFAPGRNTVEFVVYNSSGPPARPMSRMGFRAELHGEAMPLAVR